jgi:hypothetical protein
LVLSEPVRLFFGFIKTKPFLWVVWAHAHGSGICFYDVRDLICQVIRQYETDQSISPLVRNYSPYLTSLYPWISRFVYNRTKREIGFCNFVVDEAKAGDLEAIEL